MNISITPALRREIQASHESVRKLARRYHISPATVQKWRKRADTSEMPRGPKPGHCTAVPDYVAEALILFRQQTLLPLDDCLYALRVGNPALSRTTLHRYFRSRGLNSLAALDAGQSEEEFADRRMGYVHVGLMKVRVRTGEVAMLNGFERISKFAFGLIEANISPTAVGAFLHELAEAVPFQIHTVQTGSDPLFVATDHFSRACADRGIVHRLIPAVKTDPPAAVGSAGYARMEGPDYDFETIQELQCLLAQRVTEYNNNCKLKSLGGSTPAEYATRYGKQQAVPRRFAR